MSNIIIIFLVTRIVPGLVFWNSFGWTSVFFWQALIVPWALPHFLAPHVILGWSCLFPAQYLESTLLQGALVSFAGEWVFRNKIWALGVFVATGVSRFPGPYTNVCVCVTYTHTDLELPYLYVYSSYHEIILIPLIRVQHHGLILAFFFPYL